MVINIIIYNYVTLPLSYYLIIVIAILGKYRTLRAAGWVSKYGYV